MQGHRAAKPAVFWCSGTLILATIAVLLPSLPFRLGRFEYYTLSWFHFYVAASSGAIAVLLALMPSTRRNLLLLAAGMALLLLPLVHQSLGAHAFLSGTLPRLDAIGEMRSVMQKVARPGGLYNVSGLYSLLIWLWPITLGLCIYRACVERQSPRLFLWICAVCGLILLTLQFRLHYFGSFLRCSCLGS